MFFLKKRGVDFFIVSALFILFFPLFYPAKTFSQSGQDVSNNKKILEAISDITNDLKRINSEISDISKRLSESSAKINDFQNSVSSIKGDILSIKNELASFEKRLKGVEDFRDEIMSFRKSLGFFMMNIRLIWIAIITSMILNFFAISLSLRQRKKTPKIFKL